MSRFNKKNYPWNSVKKIGDKKYMIEVTYEPKIDSIPISVKTDQIENRLNFSIKAIP